jgi:glycosyltransferase involved in cell wall biosynthesis
MNNENHLHDQSARKNLTSVLIVLPVYNEEKILRESVHTLTAFLQEHDQYNWKVIIADNNSEDGTGDIGRELASNNPIVDYLYISRKGVGIAVRSAWETAESDYVNYMDIDLSTSLEALIRSVDLLSKGEDVVVANRLDRSSVKTRCLKREVVSRCYNMIIRFSLGAKFHDAHCGFKTARREVAQKLLPYIEDDGFFFAAEFLFYAERLRYKIREIPVKWTENPNTKANILKDAYDDFRGLYRLKFHNRLDMGKKG